MTQHVAALAHLAPPALDATVVVPTYNRAEVLAASLPRLLAQSVAASRYEVVVIDDGSTDGTADVVARCAAPHLRYRCVPHGGRSQARNEAILRMAQGRVLVFVDDDVFVESDYLAAHLSAHVRPDARVVATGPIVDIDAIPGDLRRRSPWTGYHRHPAPTGNASVLRDVAIMIGAFDERFTVYGWEDEDFARRLRSARLRRRFIPAAAAYHLKTPHQRTSLRYRLALEQQRGAMGAELYRKYPTLGVAIMTKGWPPLWWLDRTLNHVCDLDARIVAISESTSADEPKVSSLSRWLLLFHAEATAAHGARHPARHEPI
jgi:glycosyltransferase involved in cell wall biosynthesis